MVFEEQSVQFGMATLHGVQVVPVNAYPVEHSVHAPVLEPRQVTQLLRELQQASEEESTNWPVGQVRQAQ